MKPRSLPDNLPPRLLSKGQAAEYCGVSAGTLATHYKGPSVAIGGRILFDRNDLDAFIDGLKPDVPNSPPQTGEQWLELLNEGRPRERA